MILTIEQLTAYIRSQLGEPQIQVEVSDDQIRQVILDTVKIYTDVVYGDFEDEILVEAGHFVGRSIKLNQFTNVMKVLPTSSPERSKELVWRWSNIKRTLTLKSVDHPIDVVVVGLTRYVPDSEDHIYEESWVKDMSKAKTKLLWGNIVGKYSQSLVGGATINFERLISEAESEIEKLNEELIEKWQDPAPVLIGDVFSG